MTIRTAEAGELEACVRVLRQSFGTVAAQFGLTEQNCPTNAAFLQLPRLQRAAQRGAALYACVEDGQIVGFAQLDRVLGGVCELEKLSVLPEARHRGAGAALVRQAAQAARDQGATALHIGIIEENARLKAWYQSLGFTAAGTAVLPQLPFTVVYMELAL